MLQSIGRSPEGQYLREIVLRKWLAASDALLRKAEGVEVSRVQGDARTLAHLIDLLSPQVPRPKTRTLVIDGEAQEFVVSNKPAPLGH